MALGPEMVPGRSGGDCFADLADLYIAWSAVHNRPSTLRWKRHVVAILVDRWGELHPRDLDRQRIEAWQLRLGATRKPATVNRYLAVVRHWYSWLADRGYVDRAKVREVRSVRKLREPPGRVRWLTDDERARLLRQAGTPLREAILIALHTGLRQGELAALTWERVDLRAGVIYVEDSKSGRARSVPINRPARSALQTLRSQATSGPVLRSIRTGEPWSQWGLVTAWRRCRARANCPGVRYHDLRHDFASRLAWAGVPLQVISELMGHATIQMTLRYSHMRKDSHKRAVAELEKK